MIRMCYIEGIFPSKSKKSIKTLLPVDMYLKTLSLFPASLLTKLVPLHSMSEQVTDISKILSEMNNKLSSMEQTISEQGADISQGTVRNMPTKIGNKSKSVCEEIRRRITESAVVGVDETGQYVNSVLNWAWIFQTDKLTYVYQDKSRGMKAINKHFPDGLPDSILVTDRYGSYFNMDVKNHQVCIAHLLRNIQYLTELDLTQNWSTRVSILFREAIHIRKTTSFEAIPVASIKERLDRLLNESVTHLHEDFQKFKNGLFKCKDYLFTFLQNSNVPYDNTIERGIRKIKVKQKVGGCFRTEQGADTFMDIHSVVKTAKKNGNSKYKAILAVLEQ